LNRSLNKGDNRKCQDGVVVEVSDVLEVEVLVVDMDLVRAGNVFALTVAIGNLINGEFPVIQENVPDAV
jgi:hypothetical protein